MKGEKIRIHTRSLWKKNILLTQYYAIVVYCMQILSFIPVSLFNTHDILEKLNLTTAMEQFDILQRCSQLKIVT